MRRLSKSEIREGLKSNAILALLDSFQELHLEW